MFSGYTLRKKYALRKLTVGLFSVAVGLLSIGLVDGVNFIMNDDYGTVYAAENFHSIEVVNYYDYDTIYEGDSNLTKGDHEDGRQGESGKQIFDIEHGLSSSPIYSLGDNLNEIVYRPYEVIKDNRSKLKEHYGDGSTGGWDSNYPATYDEILAETRTHKKILIDDNIEEPIYKDDGTVILPRTIISKVGVNYRGSSSEYLFTESVEKEAISKIIKVGNVERVPISKIAVETEYVANNTLNYGVRNIKSNGKEGLRENVTTYEVNKFTGDLSNPTTVENYVPMEKKVVEVGTKGDVVFTKVGNDVVKRTTSYTVTPENGDVTPNVNDEIVKPGEVKD
ncbi:G5 domain-containing protein, partial [Streptococcus sp. 3894]